MRSDPQFGDEVGNGLYLSQSKLARGRRPSRPYPGMIAHHPSNGAEFPEQSERFISSPTITQLVRGRPRSGQMASNHPPKLCL